MHTESPPYVPETGSQVGNCYEAYDGGATVLNQVYVKSTAACNGVARCVIFEGVSDPRAKLSTFALGSEDWSGIWTFSVSGDNFYAGQRGAPITGLYTLVFGASSLGYNPAPKVRVSTACIVPTPQLPIQPALPYEATPTVANCWEVSGSQSTLINQKYHKVQTNNPRQILLQGDSNLRATLSYYSKGPESWSGIWFFAIDGKNIYQTAVNGKITGPYTQVSGVTGYHPPPNVWTSLSCQTQKVDIPINSSPSGTCVEVAQAGIASFNQKYVKIQTDNARMTQYTGLVTRTVSIIHFQAGTENYSDIWFFSEAGVIYYQTARGMAINSLYYRSATSPLAFSSTATQVVPVVYTNVDCTTTSNIPPTYVSPSSQGVSEVFGTTCYQVSGAGNVAINQIYKEALYETGAKYTYASQGITKYSATQNGINNSATVVLAQFAQGSQWGFYVDGVLIYITAPGSTVLGPYYQVQLDGTSPSFSLAFPSCRFLFSFFPLPCCVSPFSFLPSFL